MLVDLVCRERTLLAEFAREREEIGSWLGGIGL